MDLPRCHCGQPSVLALQSTVKNFLHNSCRSCADAEYEASLRQTGTSLAAVRAEQRRGTIRALDPQPWVE